MANLSEEQLAYLKRLLDQRDRDLRVELQRELNEKNGFSDVASEAPDTGDSSFANLTMDLGNAAVTREITELRAIEAARMRMANENYGDCVTCETEIPYARLQVQPTAERCAPCQDMHEKTHMDTSRGTSL